MNVIRGTIRDGKVVFDTPPDWPDGTEVLVSDSANLQNSDLLPEEEQGTDPESVAKWLAWYDALQPLIVTAEDEERSRAPRSP